MFFGDPFPPEDVDKNEAASTGSNSELEIALELDQPPIPCGSVYPALQTTDEVSCWSVFYTAAEIHDGFLGMKGWKQEHAIQHLTEAWIIKCQLLSKSKKKKQYMGRWL